MIIRTKNKKTIKGNLMCGYVFFSDRQNNVSQKILNSILDLQKHRGPDYSDYKRHNQYFFT